METRAPAADITIDALTASRDADGRPVVVATVQNTGGRALDMNGTPDLLEGPAGLTAGPFPAVLGTTLAIGATEPVTIALDTQLPAGPWNAVITLRSGLVERTAQATITFPEDGMASACLVVRRRHRLRPGRSASRLSSDEFSFGDGSMCMTCCTAS